MAVDGIKQQQQKIKKQTKKEFERKKSGSRK